MLGSKNCQRVPYFGLRGGWLTFWITVSSNAQDVLERHQANLLELPQVACATDMTLFGYDQGVFSGVVVTQDFLEVHDLVGPSKTQALSTVTAIYDVGCFFGAIIAFTVGERLGRKLSIIIGSVIMSIGTILMVSSFSLPQMFVGRIILGIGNGINTTCAPIWQTETSPPRWRGKLVMLEMVMNIAGFSIVNWINYGLSFAGGAVAWRLPIALQFIFIIVLFVTVPWLPESPRWLMSHGHEVEAIEVLASLEDKSVNDPYISTQRNEIIYSIQYEKENAISWTQLLFKANKDDSTKTLRRLLLGAGTQFIQQFEGINIMSYYLPKILINSVGLSNSMARLLTACNSVSYFCFTLLSVPLVEHWGRRWLMMLSTLGQLLCFLIITILLRFAESRPTGSAVASASVAFFFLFYISFGLGMLGIPWLYPTEISSLPMRTKSAAVATATNWICNFVIVEITPIGIQNIGWKFWIIWTVFNAAFLPVIYFFYPETANRTLEDMDAYYRSNPDLIVIRDPDAVFVKRPLKYIQHEEEEIQKNAKQGGDNLDKAVVEHAE
ncbi:hypothetical protein DTO164E3_3723 [Paecilomyces variotii]|nr:hypothetical protein DTO164E3_3723 [Paecilomyces variotii]KAJ9206168.1 hypothetical protein DTO032I3_2033 [Paecilomyces variotii]KAJ9281629.1 hypothetical protein DTO021D3_1395 [Paecilomyces variotii]KAJ9345891.1 hypothetical protein DTO027B6_1305 [Paecilomyces variotii]KAJ9392271.1 hypothetical protein DTO032I4_685 [Paecilomyces variotii]